MLLYAVLCCAVLCCVLLSYVVLHCVVALCCCVRFCCAVMLCCAVPCCAAFTVLCCCCFILCYVVLCCVVLWLCCAVLCCAVQCYAVLRYAMLCYVMLLSRDKHSGCQGSSGSRACLTRRSQSSNLGSRVCTGKRHWYMVGLSLRQYPLWPPGLPQFTQLPRSSIPPKTECSCLNEKLGWVVAGGGQRAA